MKTSLFSFILVIIILTVGCGRQGNDVKPEDKQARLEQLKAQAANINKEIEALEAELAAKSGPNTASKQVPVSVAPLQPVDFKHYISVQGKLEAKDMVMVSTTMGGQIMHIAVKEGDMVKAGQILATLDRETMEKSIEEVKNALDIATTLYNKQKSLWEQQIGTEVQYLTAKNNKESLEKRLATLRSQLNQLVVKAPYSGVVDEIYAKTGGMAAPGVPLMRLVNLGNMKAKASVPDIYITKVNKGDEVIIHFPDIDERVKGQISFVAQVVDPLTRSFTVEATFANPGQKYKPNMLAVIEINDQTKKNALVISENLIQNSENGKMVFTAHTENGRKVAKARYINTGLTYNGLIEITQGLQAGDTLITQGYQDLVDGQEIIIN